MINEFIGFDNVFALIPTGWRQNQYHGNPSEVRATLRYWPVAHFGTVRVYVY